MEDRLLSWAGGGEQPSILKGTSNWMLRWAAKPANQLMAVLAVNAIFMPFRSRYHDSMLYGLQVTNHAENNHFDRDLFLAFGSQDNYSIFSWCVAPIAKFLTVDVSFFLLYLTGITLFFLALQRLLRVLLPDPIVSSISLLFLAVAPPTVGGLDVFHVYENFLTPRLFAAGLVLFALERMLSKHAFQAALLLLIAIALHPLIAFGGWLILLFWCFFNYLQHPVTWFLGGLTSICALLILLIPSLGMRIFGPLDAAWQTEIRYALPCLFATEWKVHDWFQVLGASTILLASWRWLPFDEQQKRFLRSLGLATLLAILGAILVCYLPYALPLQGQPFRILWLVQTLQVPLGLLLIKHCWSKYDWLHRSAAILLIGYLGASPIFMPDLVRVLVFFAIFACLFQYSKATSVHRSWAWKALATSLLMTLIWRLVIQEGSLVLQCNRLTNYLDFDVCVRAFVTVIDPIFRIAIAIAGLMLLSCVVGFGSRFWLAALTIFVVVQGTVFSIQETPAFKKWNQLHHADVQFVQDFLKGRSQDKVQTIYWPIGHPEYLWFDLGVNSYFSEDQLVGNAFSRNTAIEGRRRINLVKAFEIDLTRHDRPILSDRRTQEIERLLQDNLEAAPPSLNDLLHLCADQSLDYVVARQEFPGWYSQRNQRWFIYDCQAIRSSAEFRAAIEPSNSTSRQYSSNELKFVMENAERIGQCE